MSSWGWIRKFASLEGEAINMISMFIEHDNLILKRLGGVGISWEIGIDIHTLLHIKQITNKDLLYSTGNSTQYSVMAYMGKESKKEWIYVYV